MKLIMENQVITANNIPVITCAPVEAKHLPLVLLNHGTTGCAEHMITMAYHLAKEGHFCVCIDAVWHGQRGDGKLHERLEPPVYKRNYLTMLLQMADDMSAIIDYYENDVRVNNKKVGMTGISQGGYVAFMTMTKDSRITAAAPLIGSPDLEDKYGNSPDWESIAKDVQEDVITHSPLRNYEKMFPTALLVQSCVDDMIVPVGGTRRLDEKLKPLYKDCPDQYQYIEYPGLGHEAPWEMQQVAMRWLKEKLA